MYHKPLSRNDISLDLHCNGRPVQRVEYRGNAYYVAPDRYSEYTLSITNHSSRRVAIVVSVDGLSVMSGKQASQNDTAYIIEAYGNIKVKGWRRGDEEVAAFKFASIGGSYAGRTDRPENVGIIGIIAYPEKERFFERVAYNSVTPKFAMCGGMNATRGMSKGGESITSCDSAFETGTGYGRKVEDRVQSVSFDRDYSGKVSLSYYYDTADSLEAKGIPVARPASHRRPNPFPADRSDNFCPEPV